MDSEPGSPPGSGDDSSTSFTLSRHVSRVGDRLDDLLPFALVPLVLTLVDVENVRRTVDAAPGSFSLNIEFTLPSPLLDLWSFADPPEPATDTYVPGGSAPAGDFPGREPTPAPTDSGGADVTIETPLETLEVAAGDAFVWIGIALLAYAAVSSVVAAGYLGGLDRVLRDEPTNALADVVEYVPRLLLYHLAIFGGFLALVPLLLLAPPLLLFALPAILVLGYLFYAVPFLFVVDDAGFLEAFRRSYEFAVAGGPYLGFALGHVVVAVIASVVLSIAVSAGGVVGFAIALAVATPLSLVLTAATVSFVQELVGRDGGGVTAGRSSPGSTSDDGFESSF